MVEKNNNDKKENVVEEQVRVVSDAVVSINIKMPMRQWVEWNEDCRSKYGDCRWMKMWNDHIQAKDRQELRGLFQSYFENEKQKPEETKEEEIEKPKTFSNS